VRPASLSCAPIGRHAGCAGARWRPRCRASWWLRCPCSSASMCRGSPARSPTPPRSSSRPPPTPDRRKSRSTAMNIDLESLLSALRSARGKGLSLKQLAGQLRLGETQEHPLRRALSHLLEQGRASYDGHVYREREREQGQNGERPKGGGGGRQTAFKEPRRDQARRASAAMAEGSRRREQGP